MANDLNGMKPETMTKAELRAENKRLEIELASKIAADCDDLCEENARLTAELEASNRRVEEASKMVAALNREAAEHGRQRQDWQIDLARAALAESRLAEANGRLAAASAWMRRTSYHRSKDELSRILDGDFTCPGCAERDARLVKYRTALTEIRDAKPRTRRTKCYEAPQAVRFQEIAGRALDGDFTLPLDAALRLAGYRVVSPLYDCSENDPVGEDDLVIRRIGEGEGEEDA